MTDNPQTILIIEDEQSLQDALKDKLTMQGYSVVTALNGEDGLASALQLHPNLIILDIIMPKMNGMKVLEALRSDGWGKGVPVCIFTNVDPNDKTLSMVIRDHPSYYMIKSNVTLEEICDKVQDLLRANDHTPLESI